MRGIEAGVTDPSCPPRLVCRQSWQARLLGRSPRVAKHRGKYGRAVVLSSHTQLVAAGAAIGLWLPATEQVDDEGEC